MSPATLRGNVGDRVLSITGEQGTIQARDGEQALILWDGTVTSMTFGGPAARWEWRAGGFAVLPKP